MGRVVLPPCWLFDLRWSSLGVHRLYDNGSLHKGSRQGHLPGLLLPTPASAGGLPTRASRFASISCGVTAPTPWVLVCMRFCLCPVSMESPLPPVLWKPCNQIPSKLDSLGIPSAFAGSPGWKPDVRLTTWQWKKFFGTIILLFMGHLPSRYGIQFHYNWAPPSIFLWFLICLWSWGIYFVGSRIHLSVVFQQLVAILVLS